MWKRGLIAVAVLACMAADTYPVHAQSATSQAMQKKAPRELVLRINNASIDELKGLSFFELNVLKNAVYASKGYKFADDRPWLNEVFCEAIVPENLRTLPGQKPKKAAKAIKVRRGIVVDADLVKWTDKMKSETAWNLAEYAFPACKEGGVLDEDQKKAIANVRIATFKKIESLGSQKSIYDEIWRDYNSRLYSYKNSVWALGKVITYGTFANDMAGYNSILRDVRGYQRLLELVKNSDEDFDAMEILGLYAGDVSFLRSVVEAKYGKAYTGVLGWEISQLIGVTEKHADYDPKKLPLRIQIKLQVLDSVMQKILQGELNDVPASLRSKPVQLTDDPYRGGAC